MSADDKRNSDIAAMVELVCGLSNRLQALEQRVQKLEAAQNPDADKPDTEKQ